MRPGNATTTTMTGARADATAEVEPASASTADDAPRGARTAKLGPLLALKPYLLRYRGTLALAAVALIASAATMLVVPIAVRRMIDHGFTGSDAAFIGAYFSMLLLLGTVLSVASSARAYLVNWLGERIVADVRADVFRHLTRLGPAFFERTHSGEVMSRLTADTTQIKGAAGNAISQAVRNAIMLVGSLIMMIVTSPALSLAMLVAIPAIVLPLIAFGRVVKRLSREAQDALASASSYAAENLAAVRTMQAFTNEAAVSERFTTAVDGAFEAARSRLAARAALTAVAIFLTIASTVGVLWYGATLVIAGEMSAGTLGQFVIYAILAAGALAELSEVWGEVAQASGAAERLAELLAVAPEITAPANPRPLPNPARGAITIEKVSFAYAGRAEAALEAVSLAVAPGQSIALVGPSGAGKSTLFNLLMRFYDVQLGSVRIDGIDVREVDPAALRRLFAYVPQDVALFADTIADNIRYGMPDATRDAVRRAAIAANADDFIQALPQGYDTVLGERGVQLSGGQRQRVAIARAILRDAPILLLDEATSALDTESEAAVQDALERLRKGRTTLVIAHRLSTIREADRIVVIDRGRIVEEGTHSALSARGGLYQRLAEMQFRTDPAVSAAE